MYKEGEGVDVDYIRQMADPSLGSQIIALSTARTDDHRSNGR